MHVCLQVFAQVDVVFPVLLRVLTNESNEVVIADLYVLAEVAGTTVPAGMSINMFVCSSR